MLLISPRPHADLRVPPSPWVQRWAHLIAPGGRVLDLACGSGRHVRWLAARGFKVTGVDRDGAALAALTDVAEVIEADLEAGAWPLAQRRFDAVLVTNYLWRPLWPALLAALADGGVYLHETFAQGQQTVGRPARPEFLLRPGELLAVTTALHVVAFEDGFIDAPPRFVQRIAAVLSDAPAEGVPARFPLQGAS